jgi:Transposase IS4
LRDINISACGTTRAHAAGDDYPALIKELRSDFAKKLPWNTVITFVIRSNKVLALCWQDNNVVMALSIIYTVDKATDLVKRERHRPNKSSTNTAIARQPFGDEVRKPLSISTFIDDYNHYIGGVDLANQYRAAYETHKSIRRSWFCILLALIDITVVNSYRISYLAALKRSSSLKQLPKHSDFRTRLYMHLFGFSNDPTLVQRRTNRARPSEIRFNTFISHTTEIRRTRTQCIQCTMDIGLEKRTNTGTEARIDPRRRIPKGYRGCVQCNVALCVKGPCWQR